MIVINIENPHRCVIDVDGYYKTLVSMYDPQGYELKQPYCYEMQEGERLVEGATSPHRMRWENGVVVGILRGRWDDETAAWVEGATPEEIAAWEADHPAPANLAAPTAAEQLRADVDFLAAIQGVEL